MFNFLKNSKEEKTKEKLFDQDAIDQILAKVKVMDSEIASLKGKLEAAETNISSLRNAFNRRGLKEVVQEEKKTETQGINNPIILPVDGFTR